MSGIDLRIEFLTDVVVVGRGSFASVYGATDTRFARRVAVKVGGNGGHLGSRGAVERACDSMGRLSGHPNVIAVHGSGLTGDGRPYLIMDLVEGGSLADRVAGAGPIPWMQAVRYVDAVAGALQAAHEAGILHRDIKPANILLDRGRPRLTGFASVRLSGVGATTVAGSAVDRCHVAPEAFDRLGDERSDLYSLASTLYTLIAGHDPFFHERDNSIHPADFQLVPDVPPVLPPDLAPPGLRRFVERAMSKDPADRPGDVSSFRSELCRSVWDCERPSSDHCPQRGVIDADGNAAELAADVVDIDRFSGPAWWQRGTGHFVDQGSWTDAGRGIRGVPDWMTAPGATPVSRSRHRSPFQLFLAAGAIIGSLQALLVVLPDGRGADTVAASAPGPQLDQTTTIDRFGAVPGNDDDELLSTMPMAGSESLLAREVTGGDSVGGTARSVPGVYRGHGSTVLAVTGLTDGRAVSASADGTVREWTTQASDHAARVYRGHTGEIWAVAVLADGRVASAGADGTVRVWAPDEVDTDGRATGLLLGHSGAVLCLAALPDGRLVSGGADDTVRVWDPDDPAAEPIVYQGHQGMVRAVAALADGRVVSAGGDRTVQLWDPGVVGGGSLVFAGHEGAVNGVAALADGRVVSAGADGTVRVWDPGVVGGGSLVFAGHGGAVNGVAALADGRVVSAGADGTVRVWEPAATGPAGTESTSG